MRVKPILPSLKEKKRYLAYEIIADKRIDAQSAEDVITKTSLDYLGALGYGEAGIQVLKETHDNNRGLIRVGHKHVDRLKAALIFITKIKNQNVIVRSLGVSGVIKKAKEKYLEAK
ncbi:hypothetical protein DRJ17_02785 [Candidatus Woesearchaeota archaeon]|nr:MAG: hypothetical protein DRJ17_02785 [Candidatus Woesearchaeota archaeon]